MLPWLGPVLLASWIAPAALPMIDAELPQPVTGLPAVERSARWFGLIEPSLAPARIKAASAELGLDLLTPVALEAVGVSTKKPMRILFDPSTRTVSVAFALENRRRALAWLGGLGARAKERPEISRLGDAILIDVQTPYLLAVVLEKDRLLIQLPEGPKLSFFEQPVARMRAPVTKKASKKWKQHPRLSPLAELAKKKSFARPKLETDTPPALYFRTTGGGLAATAGALVANDQGFSVHLLWALDGRGQIAMGELMSQKGRARMLLDEAPLRPALSLRARLLGSGARLLAGRLGVPEALTSGLAGGVHAVLTANGELVLDLEVTETFGEPGRAALEEALRRRVSAAKVELDPAAGRLGILVGSPDLSGLRKPGKEDLAPVVLELQPEHLSSVLGGVRDRYGPRYQLDNMELMAARMLLDPLARATQSVRLELAPHGAAVVARADIRYRE